MKFYKYWVREKVQPDGCDFPVTGFGYSNESIDAALRVARERAAQTAAGIRENRNDVPRDIYYGDRPIREEIVEQFDFENRMVAVITRNSYGCLVLNAANVLFADVDFPEKKTSFLGGLFGKKSPDPAEQLVAEIEAVVQSNPVLGIRLYRTFNGFRCIVTSREYRPRDTESKQLLQQLGSDPMYVKLCESQDCYRARLSPKPWRIGMSQPSLRFPFEDESRERQYREWVEQYNRQSATYSTCALIGDFGSKSTLPAVEMVVQLHDHYSISGDGPIA